MYFSFRRINLLQFQTYLKYPFNLSIYIFLKKKKKNLFFYIVNSKLYFNSFSVFIFQPDKVRVIFIF